MSHVIVLVGLMGSGKTTVGRRLATRLGARFVDTDDVVVARAGKSVRDIFTQDGEAVFRELESKALEDSLCGEGDVVVAAAGGCVLSQANRDTIKNSATLTMWLDAELSALAQRVSGGSHRPLLDGGAEEKLLVLERERRELYQSVCDVRIDTTGKPVNDVVDEAAALIIKAGVS